MLETCPQVHRIRESAQFRLPNRIATNAIAVTAATAATPASVNHIRLEASPSPSAGAACTTGGMVGVGSVVAVGCGVAAGIGDGVDVGVGVGDGVGVGVGVAVGNGVGLAQVWTLALALVSRWVLLSVEDRPGRSWNPPSPVPPC